MPGAKWILIFNNLGQNNLLLLINNPNLRIMMAIQPMHTYKDYNTKQKKSIVVYHILGFCADIVEIVFYRILNIVDSVLKH